MDWSRLSVLSRLGHSIILQVVEMLLTSSSPLHAYSVVAPNCPQRLRRAVVQGLGFLMQGTAETAHQNFRVWPKQFGKTSKYFLGRQAYVLCSDPELIQQAAVKQFMTFHDRYNMVPQTCLRQIRSDLLSGRVLPYAWNMLTS